MDTRAQDPEGIDDSVEARGVPEWGLGAFVRWTGNPVLAPRHDSVFHCPVQDSVVHWEAKNVVGAAAAVRDGRVVLLYRAEPKLSASLASDLRSAMTGYVSSANRNRCCFRRGMHSCCWNGPGARRTGAWFSGRTDCMCICTPPSTGKSPGNRQLPPICFTGTSMDRRSPMRSAGSTVTFGQNPVLLSAATTMTDVSLRRRSTAGTGCTLATCSSLPRTLATAYTGHLSKPAVERSLMCSPLAPANSIAA